MITCHASQIEWKALKRLNMRKVEKSSGVANLTLDVKGKATKRQNAFNQRRFSLPRDFHSGLHSKFSRECCLNKNICSFYPIKTSCGKEGLALSARTKTSTRAWINMLFSTSLSFLPGTRPSTMETSTIINSKMSPRMELLSTIMWSISIIPGITPVRLDH